MLAIKHLQAFVLVKALPEWRNYIRKHNFHKNLVSNDVLKESYPLLMNQIKVNVGTFNTSFKKRFDFCKCHDIDLCCKNFV